MVRQDEFNPSAVAFDLGDAAVNQSVDRLEEIRNHEKQRLEQVNAAEIISLNAELALRTEERDALREDICRMPKPDPMPRRSRIWYVSVALVLGAAGFSFAHLALAPFGLGWQVWPYSVALAVVCAYATDETLEKCNCRALVVITAVTSLLTGLAGLLLMAVVRGDVLALYLKTAMSSGMADAATLAGNAADAVRFYEGAARKLQLFFAFLAVSMELATGLAIYEARKVPLVASSMLAEMRRRLALAEAEMIMLLHRIEFLKREPEAFAHEFTRDFYLGLIQGTARRGAKYLGRFAGALILASFLLAPPAVSQTYVVEGLDLTLTSAAKNYDGGTEYMKDVDAAARLTGTLPAGSRFRVLGITDRSFTKPLVLLSGAIPPEHGPLTFIDQIGVARDRFAADLRQVGAATPPKYRETDLIGFLWVAGEILRQAPERRKTIVIFSDMRHSAPPPDIETPRTVPVA
jgi:hypothetical protein